MKMIQMKMKELYPQMISGNGIMTDLTSYNVPWTDSVSSILDLGYYTHSGQKLASPMIIDISENGQLSPQSRSNIANLIYNIYGSKWIKLFNLLSLEYNPINNYRMSEEETIDNDISKSNTDTGTISTSNEGTIEDETLRTGSITNATDSTVTNSGTEGGTKTVVTDNDTTNTGTQTNSGSSNTLNGIFGFNSDDSVGSDTSDNTNSNTRTDNLAGTSDTTETETRDLTSGNTENVDSEVTETRSLADTNTKTLDTTDLETRNLAHSETVSNDSTRELTREGTTGIYTPQQLIKDEIEVWQWNFFNQVFKDIDSICCLSIY